LPANWVRAPTTGQMTALTGAAAPMALGWDRDIYGLGFDLQEEEYGSDQYDQAQARDSRD
jgi:hypothetical protein